MTGGRGAGFRFQRVSGFKFQVSGGFRRFQRVSGGFRRFQRVSGGFRFQEVSSFRGRGESNAGVRALLV